MLDLESPAFKCLEASCMLKLIQHRLRSHSSAMEERIQLSLSKLQFRAENLAGEAGHEAAHLGMSPQVPQSILSFSVLARAYLAEYSLVINHFNFDTAATRARQA